MILYRVILLSAAVATAFCTVAQTDTRRNKFDDFQKQAYEEFNRWSKQAGDDYSSFIQKANAEYAQWMKQAWDTYKASPAIPKPKDRKRPSPIVICDDTLNRAKPRSNPIVFDEVIPAPTPKPQPMPVEPIRVKKLPEKPVQDEPAPAPLPDVSPEKRSLNFAFYSTPCSVRFPDGIADAVSLRTIDNPSISDAWNRLSNAPTSALIADCLHLRDTLSLSDWAYFCLVDNIADATQLSPSEKSLLSAFIICQSGYKIRLCKTSSRLYYLFASPYIIYGQSYYRIGTNRFYGFKCPETSVEIFNREFPGEKTLSLSITREMKIADDPSEPRTIASNRYNDLKITASVNKNLLSFFDSYPDAAIGGNDVTRWAMYADTPLSSDVKDAIYPTIRKAIENLSPKEAAEKILNLVQTGLTYEYDDKVWGRDRAFFAEETLFYPFADCEDRSILFSRLIRDILGLDVVLIYYPGHVSTAIDFADDTPEGDHIILDGKPYIVADPTYIGAPLGLTMPSMDNSAAKVLLLAK